MSKELVISSNRHEMRVALLDEDQLVEVYFQRADEYSLAGSIHKGRVTRVLPGMQSAFVDVGLERDTFLYVSDFLEEAEDIDRVTGEERPPRQDRDRDRDRGRRDQHDRPQAAPSAVPPPLPTDAQAEGMGEATASTTAVGPATEAIDATSGGASTASGAPRGDQRGDARGNRGGDRDGDRRGRRSRRRRSRGQGFPDAKYAAPAASGPPEPERPREAPTATEDVPALPPLVLPSLVLPGESLRKYRGTPTEIAAVGVQAPYTQSEDIQTEDAQTEDTTEYDEPVHYPPENALPDAPAHGLPPPLPEPPAFVMEPGATAAFVEELAPANGAGQEGWPVHEEQSDEEEEGASTGALDEDEDRDIQAMILGGAEGVDLVEADAAEEGETDGEAESSGAQEAGAADSASAAGEPTSGTAEVRERGGRYPHRVSRRLRRRGRPGQMGGPEGRPPDAREPDPRETGNREPAHREPAGPDQFRRREQGRGDRTVARPTSPAPSISDLLKEGQEIIVQIAKEPLGQKGARITSHIALPGRYVVFMPTLEHMGVSRKIASDEERLRLKRVLQASRPGPVGGFITRTAAEGRSAEEIAADMLFLYNLWQDIRTKAERKPAPVLLHHDLDITERILRDQLADTFKAIWIDNEETYENVVRFVERFQPALVGKVKLYTREAPIFDAFGITAELEKALRPKVWLKSGGYIVINQTEALVAIDVNTGKFVGKSNRLEDTIVKTNTEAIKEIVRQVRLRDLGGIIVIDFIDMDERKNRQKVMQVLEEAMRVDRAPYKILQFNDFGLVAITRKRVKQSLERTLCSPCPHCDGAGYVKSVQTVVSEILTEARKMSGSVESKDVMLRVHPDVAKVLKSHQNKYLEELEEVLKRPVLVKSDPLLHHEKFDLA